MTPPYQHLRYRTTVRGGASSHVHAVMSLLCTTFLAAESNSIRLEKKKERGERD